MMQVVVELELTLFRSRSVPMNTRYMYTVCSNTAYTEDCMMQVVVELELTLFRSRSVPMKCLALLLESALREENFTIAAEVCTCTCNLYYLEGANMFMFVVISFSVML